MENFKKFYAKAYQVFETWFYTILVLFTLAAVFSFFSDLAHEREVTVLGYKPTMIL